MENDFSIRTARYGFCCPACGTMVKKGDNYVEENGIATCTCRIPVSPLHRKAADDVHKALEIVAKQNLKMRLELEVVSMHPEGTAARRILSKYSRLRLLRKAGSSN